MFYTARQQSGFSLLELAIALAILALLTGGVLKGRELLNSANVQATQTDLNNLETAIAAFQTRYAALPGDFAGAAAAGIGTNGSGNGLIDDAEIGHVFNQLQIAGFIQGNYTPPTANATVFCDANSCQPSKLGGFYTISHSATGPSSRNNALSIEITQSASARQLAELDRKMDDGNPNRGSIQVLSADVTNCVSGNAWNETATCGAVYLLN